MGNNQSRELEEFKQNYIKHGETNNPNYGHVTFYHSRYNPQEIVLVKDKWTNSLTESQEIAGFIENRKNITDTNLAENKYYIQTEDRQWFTTFHKHINVFEFYDNNLARRIRDHNSFNTNNFDSYNRCSEPELWYIANSLVNLDTKLAREGGSYHGDIQPSTIMFDPLNEVKIIDNGLIHANKLSYNRMLYDKSAKVALSPLLCEQMQQTKVNPEYDPSKEDSWALGMTMLCAGTNTSLDDYYDWQKPEIKTYMINDSLDQINGAYSKQVCGFITSCLEESQDARPSMENHANYLAPYQRQAENLQLNFNRATTVQPKPISIPNPVPRIQNYTDIVGGGNFFEQSVAPRQNFDFGGIITSNVNNNFFDNVQEVMLDERDNFFM